MFMVSAWWSSERVARKQCTLRMCTMGKYQKQELRWPAQRETLGHSLLFEGFQIYERTGFGESLLGYCFEIVQSTRTPHIHGCITHTVDIMNLHICFDSLFWPARPCCEKYIKIIWQMKNEKNYLKIFSIKVYKIMMVLGDWFLVIAPCNFTFLL